MSNGRLNKRHAENSRNAIKVTQIINRLQDYANGDNDVKLDSKQIKAYEILLKHSLPALNATEVTEIKEERKPHEAIQELMALLDGNPELARKISEIAHKKPELKVINEA